VLVCQAPEGPGTVWRPGPGGAAPVIGRDAHRLAALLACGMWCGAGCCEVRCGGRPDPTANRRRVRAPQPSAPAPFAPRQQCAQYHATRSPPGTAFWSPRPRACKRSSRGQGRSSAAPGHLRERGRNACSGHPRTRRRLRRRDRCRRAHRHPGQPTPARPAGRRRPRWFRGRTRRRPSTTISFQGCPFSDRPLRSAWVTSEPSGSRRSRSPSRPETISRRPSGSQSITHL
jgi:hypothetical protein